MTQLLTPILATEQGEKARRAVERSGTSTAAGSELMKPEMENYENRGHWR